MSELLLTGGDDDDDDDDSTSCCCSDDLRRTLPWVFDGLSNNTFVDIRFMHIHNKRTVNFKYINRKSFQIIE